MGIAKVMVGLGEHLEPGIWSQLCQLLANADRADRIRIPTAAVPASAVRAGGLTNRFDRPQTSAAGSGYGFRTLRASPRHPRRPGSRTAGDGQDQVGNQVWSLKGDVHRHDPAHGLRHQGRGSGSPADDFTQWMRYLVELSIRSICQGSQCSAHSCQMVCYKPLTD